MPYQIAYSDSDGGVITTYSGIVTDETVIESARERLSCGRKIESYRYFISDYTDVSKSTVTRSAVQISASLALEASKINKDILLVGVFPTDLGYGMGRMWQAYAADEETGWKTKVVRSLAEAHIWIQKMLVSKSP